MRRRERRVVSHDELNIHFPGFPARRRRAQRDRVRAGRVVQWVELQHQRRRTVGRRVGKHQRFYRHKRWRQIRWRVIHRHQWPVRGTDLYREVRRLALREIEWARRREEHTRIHAERIWINAIGQAVAIRVRIQRVRAERNFCPVFETVVVRVRQMGIRSALKLLQVGQAVVVRVKASVVHEWVEAIRHFITIRQAIAVHICCRVVRRNESEDHFG